jgi:ankyrin repeat protein
MSFWEILLIGVVLGAFAMRCAMLDHRLHWLKLNATSRTESKNTDSVCYDVGEYSDDKEDVYSFASPRLLEDAEFSPGESLASTDEDDQMESAQVVKETHNEQSIESNSDVTAVVAPLNGDAIELEDLDHLENYLYGDVPVVPFQASPAEPDEPPGFPDAMWKVSFSVDAVMRPIQELFAPELVYRAIDADLCTPKLQSDAFRDNRDIVKSILRSIGRFAIRQDNRELLTKVWDYSASADQDELWQFLEVAIEYGKLPCFQYLMSFVDEKDAQNRALEWCTYHDQVEMMKQAFDKWTTFVKSDTANALLVMAAAQGQMKSVQFLLTKCISADIDIVSSFINEHYPNAVMAAAAGGHVAILQELIAAGANVFKESKLYHLRDGILEIAQEKDHPELMQFVLTERKKDSGWHKPRASLLRSACERGQLEIMHTLINHGANFYEILPDGFTRRNFKAMPHTTRERHRLIVELLRVHCKEGYNIYIPQSSVISRLAWLGDVEGLRMLFDEEPDVEVNVADQCGSSPLFYAMMNHMKMLEGKLVSTRQQWLRTIRLLLARGARLNMTDTQYWYTHHGGIPKEILSGLKEMSKSTKSHRNLRSES